jgi:D-glycero-alpha-D-manno-heptose-7-phosphate kinase
MIITRAPLRMSFVGGGSDLPSFYTRFGGAVLSTAIDKYVFVTVNRKFDDAIRISYSRTELVQSVDAVAHELVRACMKLTGVTGGVEITTIADIPSRGTGLGSSSSFTAALLHGLYAFRGEYVSAARIAEETCHVEIDLCGAPIGKQDQYASAYGGLNFIEFQPDGAVDISPIICSPQTVSSIQDNLLMFYTGRTRSASSLLATQSRKSENDERTQDSLKQMVALAYKLRTELQANNCAAFGEILHENWLLKRSLTEGVSNAELDGWYQAAMDAGALGGKLLGAGAGGFLLFYAPRERHAQIKAALSTLRHIPVAFERSGSQVIFYNP